MRSAIAEMLDAWGDPEDIPIPELRQLAYRHLTFLEPVVRQFAEAVERGCGWLVTSKIGFLALPARERHVYLLGFCTMVGELSPTDPLTQTKLWRVAPRFDLPDTYDKSITESDGEADLHLDSSFIRVPEDYVALFVVNPACDGGASVLINGRTVIEQLVRSVRGRQVLTTLRRASVPFWIPPTFRDANRNDHVVARILQPCRLRYRRDCIDKGLKIRPELHTQEFDWALRGLQTSLKGVRKTVIALLPGEALLTDNRWVLHGREDFRDRSRLLLRVRMRRTTAIT